MKQSLQELGVGFLELGPDELMPYLPNVDTNSYYPQKWVDDPDFGKPSGRQIPGAVWVPESGYISDPKLSTHNAQVAAENKGAKFLFNTRVIDILKKMAGPQG